MGDGANSGRSETLRSGERRCCHFSACLARGFSAQKVAIGKY